ncbi:MAG: hypothetical protein ACQESR_13955 [Planctomycetota bacterium]
MESCPTQAVLPLVGLAAEKVIRDRDNSIENERLKRDSAPGAHIGLMKTPKRLLLKC